MRKQSIIITSLFLLLVFGVSVFTCLAEAGETSWVSEGESSPRGFSEVSSAIKDPDASGGVAKVCYPATSRRGSVAYAGPMTIEQPPGIYNAVFRLKVEDHTNKEVVANLTVWQEGLGIIANRGVQANEFKASGKYQNFAVKFTRAPGGYVACYINWRGGYGDTLEPIGTTLWIDKVTIKQVHKFTKAELEEQYPQAWQPKTYKRAAIKGPLRVLIVRGPQYPWFRIEEALALLPTSSTSIRRCNFASKIRDGDVHIAGTFPATREKLFEFDVVVLVDVDALALGVTRRQMINDFVRSGGGLLVCGGPFAYGKGRYQKTALEGVMPVLSNGPWDWKSVSSPIVPAGANGITDGLKWKPSPYVLWYHTARLRPDAVTVLKAGNDPLLVTGRIGKGRSAALLATALGKAKPGETAFWDWPSWPRTVANTLRWLAGRKLSAARVNAQDSGHGDVPPILVAETLRDRITFISAATEANPALSNELGLVGGFRRTNPTQPPNLGLSRPTGLTKDKQGRIYITDVKNHRVVRIDDLTGDGLVSLGEYGDQSPPDVPGTLPMRLHRPYDTAIDSKGRIYISDTSTARIVRSDDMAGTNWMQIGERPHWDAQRGHFRWPLGLALDSKDRLYIADCMNNRLVRIDDIDGTGWTVCHGGSAKGQQFKEPTDVAIGQNDEIYVVDSANDRVIRISDIDGSNWQAINNLDRPVSVTVTRDGQVYVGLAHTPGVYVFDSIKSGDSPRVLRTQSAVRGVVFVDVDNN